MPVDQNLMDWNDSIESDGQEFILLEEGDYNYVVTNFERGRFPGGQKIPACNKATITVQVDTADGVASIKFDLLLYRSVEWKISAFAYRHKISPVTESLSRCLPLSHNQIHISLKEDG